MAKRTTNRSQASDTATPAPSQPKARRSRGPAAAEPDTLGAFPDVERTEDDAAMLNEASGDIAPSSAESGAAGETTSSSSMASEPSNEDIRMRAYQRYQERGGGDGMDFEDWLEAERELKDSRDRI